MENDILISVVMPCLNEEKTLKFCIRQAQQAFSNLGIKGEVVVANNNSTDSSAQIATENGAVLTNITQRGYGAALAGGFKAANGKYIIMGDADQSYDFSASSLKPFIDALQNGADFVIGNRFKGGIAPHAMPPLHRYFGTPLMSAAVRALFKVKIGDVNCGLRAFNKQKILALNLKSTGMEFASEMVARAARNGLIINEVPTTLKPDGRDRKPHLRSFRDGFRHLNLWLKIFFEKGNAA